MRPPLHIDNDVYCPLSAAISTSESPYPAFPTAVEDDDPAIDDDSISGFRHGQSDGSSHAASSHSLVHNNGFQIDPQLSNEAPRQRVARTALSLREELAQHATSMRSLQRVPPPKPQLSAPPIVHMVDTGQFDMAPPPSSTYSSWQALHDFAQSHASTHGYALSINTTAKNRSRIKLACVCYGMPKNTHKLTAETRVRKNRVSYKTGCKMWVEGKKQEDGSWLLRVGEPAHNHPGRAVEGWAVQRKRTWGVQGGRVGVGGVTAKEEKEKLQGDADTVMEGEEQSQEETRRTPLSTPSYSLESGGLVWKIVEQEMLRKGGPGQGRDRGVGRTVQALQERLPGIRIFKRDVYNIRAQIKRARRMAGQEIGEGLNASENEAKGETASPKPGVDERRRDEDVGADFEESNYSEIDPRLVAQCNDALRNVAQEESEVDRLRREMGELRRALTQRTKELEDKSSENDSLRMQVELANMAMYNNHQRGEQP